MTRIIEAVPERIWLYVKQWLNSGNEEIRWSSRSMNDGVEYVRADLIEHQAKEIEALRALLNDIKLFDVDSGVERMKKGEPAFSLPIELRKRIQQALTGQ